MATDDETYLGDGVYASLDPDGHMIRLRVWRAGDAEDHIIYLEPEVYVALRAFARKIGFEPEPEK